MQTIRFAVVGDLHVGGTAEEVQTTIRLVNQADVDFVLFMGDLVDKVLDPNIEEFVGQVKRIDKPVYLTIGNHDTARYAEGYDIEKVIAANLPGPWSDGFTYSFQVKGWNFIVVGIATMSIPGYTGPQINRLKGFVSETGGMIFMPRPHLEKFVALLQASGEMPTTISIHTPLLRMSKRIRARGCYSQVRLLEEPGVVSLIEDRPNVKVLLYGHEHFNQVEVVGGRLHCITQGVRGYPPYKDTHAIRIVEYSDAGVKSHLIWEGVGPTEPGSIGTLAGDKAFVYEFH